MLIAYIVADGKLCEKDYNRLKEWDRYKPLQNKKAARLTKQGKQDMFFLGVRFKNYFPELFQPRSSNSLEKLYQVIFFKHNIHNIKY